MKTMECLYYLFSSSESPEGLLSLGCCLPEVLIQGAGGKPAPRAPHPPGAPREAAATVRGGH